MSTGTIVRRGEVKPEPPRVSSDTSLGIFLDPSVVKFEGKGADIRDAVERILDELQPKLQAVRTDDTLSEKGRRAKKEAIYVDGIARLDKVRERTNILIGNEASRFRNTARARAIEAAQQLMKNYGEDAGGRRAEIRRHLTEKAGSSPIDIKLELIRLIRALPDSDEGGARAAELMLAAQSAPIAPMLDEPNENDVLDEVYRRIPAAAEKWAAYLAWHEQHVNTLGLLDSAENWLVGETGYTSALAGRDRESKAVDLSKLFQ